MAVGYHDDGGRLILHIPRWLVVAGDGYTMWGLQVFTSHTKQSMPSNWFRSLWASTKTRATCKGRRTSGDCVHKWGTPIIHHQSCVHHQCSESTASRNTDLINRRARVKSSQNCCFCSGETHQSCGYHQKKRIRNDWITPATKYWVYEPWSIFANLQLFAYRFLNTIWKQRLWSIPVFTNWRSTPSYWWG